MTDITPFRVKVSPKETDAVLERVARFSWDDHPMPVIAEGGDRWAYGADKDYLRQLCRHWTTAYDWRETEKTLNSFPHYKAEIDGFKIHFIHQKGSGEGAALLLTHGWPGSVLEFMEALPRLTNPERFGGDAKDGLDVIAPSLPGYGFSSRPPKPIGPRGTAALWEKLTRQLLGYESYIAQGGDWGAAVSGWLGFDHALQKGGGCRAIHLNMFGLRAGGVSPETEEEKAWARSAAMMMEMEMAYFRMQATKPQTLSYALMDSPVGIAAWIVEKFHRWSDIRPKKPEDKPRGDHIENAHGKNALLGNIMLYCLTRSFATSTWFYRGLFEEGSMELPPGETIAAPCGIARYPGEFIPFPPRRMVEATYSGLIRDESFPRGGHFAAMEEPQLFAEDLWRFARALEI